MVVHLNIHTAYDLLQSTVKIESLVKRAYEDGQSALAITDFNTMFGVQKFYDACLKYNIQPIIGISVYVTDGLNTTEAVLLAENNTGYENLIKLSSKISLKSWRNVPLSQLNQYAEGLIKIYKNVETSMQYIVQNEDYICHLTQMNHPNKVYIQSVLYEEADGKVDLTVLKAIESNEKLMLETLSVSHGDYYFKLTEELVTLPYIEATNKIANRCNVQIPRGFKTLPHFKTPNDEPSEDYLWTLLMESKHNIPYFDDRYEARLIYEFNIIKSMGYSDYFLIVQDLIRFSREAGILVGPGRGSSGGSLISYLLKITRIDPIEHDLYFERFLNPERVTMPDIDIDFQDTRRDEVIQYAKEMYGDFHVSGIVTFDHLLARAVMREVGRILQFTDTDLKMVSHLIPRKLGITLDEALEIEEFNQFINQDERYKRWFNIAKRIEGLPRHTSVHAAGVMISDEILTNTVPLIQGDLMPVTQWTMTEVEALGLLKIDFLGLRNLTIIERILKSAKMNIDFDTINEQDKLVYEQLSLANTTGIFQLESDGIRQVLKSLKPEHFEDIVAVLSLYRPGPMEQIPIFIRRRHGEPVEYIHNDLKPILEKTYGVIIYQEQIMQIANQFAGFTMGEADNLRRAMSKKNLDVLESERQHFIEGSIQNGYDEATAVQIYDLILKFANYGFPRAHAVAYAKIAYMMMYLKVHASVHFYAAIMSNVVRTPEKLSELLIEIKSNNIPYKKPSINDSHWYFKSSDEGIIFSLGMIKGIGYNTVLEIVNERQNGRYKDIYDFCHRLPSRVITKPILESLILVGAFDEFGHARATLLASLDDILRLEKNSMEDDFLEALGLTLKKIYREKEEMSVDQLTNYEKEYLGFFISTHPIEHIFNNHLYLPLYQISTFKDHQWLLVHITNVRKIRTKKGQPMAFLTVTDGIASMECVLFPELFSRFEHYLNEDALVIKGKMGDRGQLVIHEVERFETFKTNYMQHISKLYLLKIPEIALNDGPIAMYYYDLKENKEHFIQSIDLISAKKLIEQHPPELIRII